MCMLEGGKVVSTLFLSFFLAAEEEMEQHGLKHFCVLFILFNILGWFPLKKNNNMYFVVVFSKAYTDRNFPALASTLMTLNRADGLTP